MEQNQLHVCHSKYNEDYCDYVFDLIQGKFIQITDLDYFDLIVAVITFLSNLLFFLNS